MKDNVFTQIIPSDIATDWQLDYHAGRTVEYLHEYATTTDTADRLEWLECALSCLTRARDIAAATAESEVTCVDAGGNITKIKKGRGV